MITFWDADALSRSPSDAEAVLAAFCERGKIDGM
jgi:hypothetical protein